MNVEAKDTILNWDRLNAIDLKNAESNFTDALFDVAKEQAEVSFKAGIKEAVEWINTNTDVDFNEEQRHLWEDDWQVKQKEWGKE